MRKNKICNYLLEFQTLQRQRKQIQCQSKLSFHLKTLKEANLVYARQEGRWIYYSLNSAQFEVLEHYLAQYRLINQVLPAPACKDS